MAQIGDGLQRGTIWYKHGVTYCCGWASNAVWFCKSSRADLERETVDGSNYLVKVVDVTPGEGEDPPRSCGTICDDGTIRVVVEIGGALKTYASSNIADGFVEV